MPSPFAVLSETPARRRARRVARLKAKAAAESGDLTSPEDLSFALDEDEDVDADHELLPVALSFESPTQSLSTDAHRRAFRDASRHQLGRQRGGQPVPQPALRSGDTPAPSAAGFPFMGLGAAFGTWGRAGDDDGSVAAPAAAGLFSAVQASFASVQQTLGSRMTEEEREARVLNAMRNLPMRSAISVWRNAIAERRERARRFRQANAEGVRVWLLHWRIKPHFSEWVESARKIKLMKYSIYMMKNSDRRGALIKLIDNAHEVRTRPMRRTCVRTICMRRFACSLQPQFRARACTRWAEQSCVHALHHVGTHVLDQCCALDAAPHSRTGRAPSRPCTHRPEPDGA